MSIEILTAGPGTTVQDLGRPGYAHLGVSPGGAADPRSLARANLLAGNPAGAAALEATLRGPALTADEPVTLALAGGSVDPGEGPHRLAPGERFDVGPLRRGLRVYLAVRGGLVAPRVLGSASTDIRCALGPSQVRDGDRFAVGEAAAVSGGPPEPVPLADPATVRVLPGPRAERLAPGAWRRLLEQSWAASPAVDRAGVRLSGEPLPGFERGWPSEGMIAGAIQVPPDGQPIILLCEYPTTGGYPVLGVVAPDDLPVVAQLRPGARVSFTSSGGTGR